MAEVEATFPSADRHRTELRATAELERLPGVIAAAVWLDQDGELRDARIHSMPGASPTIIGNAAGRVLQALDIPFDALAIRITALALPDELSGPDMVGTGARFLLLHDITFSRAGSQVSCRVQLAREDRISGGEAHEMDTTAGRSRAAANATLRAAEDGTEGLALGLEGALVIELFGRSYAVVSVEASSGRRAANLCGLVPIDETRGPEDAVCLATLRAIDRWIAG